MIIEFFRSSSYNNWDYCSQQYFLNYVLGLPRTDSKKALKGTIAHKVLECLAIAKQALDKRPLAEYIDLKEDIGEYRVYRNTFTSQRQLTDDEVFAVNRTRKNKYTYKHKCELAKGSHRCGEKIVSDLIQMAYKSYSVKCDGWEPVDLKDITNFVWMALEYKNGMFDPRFRTIVAPEQPFDITIEKEWAKYDYIHPQTGERRQGYLTIRGTMDLITKLDDETYEIVDWKSGQRLDWATGQAKDFKKLSNDFQLMLYHYAASHIFKDIKHIIVTIFFMRDGGPFTLCFDRSELNKTEELLAQRFAEIKACQLPKMCDPTQKDFRCKSLCDYYDMPSPDKKFKNFCTYAHNYTKLYGIDKATKDLTHGSHDINHYEAPGALE
jgi:hypothetical protein